MFFREKRLNVRLNTAKKLLSQEKFEEAHVLLVSILNAQPQELMKIRVGAYMAETEYSCGNLRNAMYYAKSYLDAQSSITAMQSNDEDVALKNRIKLIVAECEKPHSSAKN